MLTLRNIAYRVDGRLLFEGVTAQIGARRRLGLVGRNGCGKTTLLRLIAGRLEPDEGEIVGTRGLSIRLVDQEVPGGPETPRAAVLAAHEERAALIAEAEGAEAARRAEIEARLAEIGAHAAPARAARLLAGLGIDEAMQQVPLADLSGGWRMRVALAAGLFVEPDLLLLDEPTNHLDLEAAAWLEAHLKRYPRALVVVSHDRTLLDAVPDGILHMAGRGLTYYPGNYTRFAKTHAESVAAAQARQTRIEAKRRQLQGFVDRFRYNASKARQAQSRIKALAKLADEPVAADERTPDLTFPEPTTLAPPLMSLADVSVGYEPGRPVLRGLDLRIDPGERIALLGANGNGKSTFAKLLADLLPPERGTVVQAPKLAVGYFAQHQIDMLEPDGTAFGHLARLMPDAAPDRIRARLGAFGFGGEKADVAVAALSGGEKARLNLALVSYRAPQLLVLDEPTNHLDIQSRRALVEAIEVTTARSSSLPTTFISSSSWPTVCGSCRAARCVLTAAISPTIGPKSSPAWARGGRKASLVRFPHAKPSGRRRPRRVPSANPSRMPWPRRRRGSRKHRKRSKLSRRRSPRQPGRTMHRGSQPWAKSWRKRSGRRRRPKATGSPQPKRSNRPSPARPRCPRRGGRGPRWRRRR